MKKVFGDTAIAAELAKRNIRLSSANPINWGRLVPQIVYYFAAYAQLIKAGRITCLLYTSFSTGALSSALYASSAAAAAAAG